MPADRLLNTVLQYYQDTHDAAKTEQVLGTTTHLLTQLSNPLNLGVLTSQFLTARAIWQNPDGLRTTIRIISVYNTAAAHVHRQQETPSGTLPAAGQREGGGLRCDEWARAVVKGADDRSRRWQHLLVLTGVLMGMESNDKRALSRSLRNTLQSAIVTAANLALESNVADGPLAGASIVMALNFAFPLLSEFHQSQINADALLPLAIWAMVSEEGFQDARFLHDIAQELTMTPGNVLAWQPQAHSFHHLQEMDKRPLVANMGPLSKLIGFAVHQARDSRTVLQTQESLLIFSRKTFDAWHGLPLSSIDPAAEATSLSLETLQTTLPVLSRVLRKLLFGVVSILQAVVSRGLLDPNMVNHAVAPGISAKNLHILRYLTFISSRDGNNAFQVYSFVYLTSIDTISRSPVVSQRILEEIRPNELATFPTGHLQRTLDLFFLNLAEHLPLTLSTEACDELIIKPALSYLSSDEPISPSMVELFESAHCAVLSVMSCPQHGPLIIRMAPFYIVRLFESFPRNISTRQFRVAFKTVMQIVSPPFPVAASEPHLSETLLEMLLSHMANASTAPLPPGPDAASRGEPAQKPEEPMSEQSSLTLALVDSLPFLPLPLVDEWLTITAQALNAIADSRLRETVKKRFWDILVSGEMDVERAAIGVAWWGTKGGRELVLYGGAPEIPMMSGALSSDEKTSRL